jgi:hypothetical protein
LEVDYGPEPEPIKDAKSAASGAFGRPKGVTAAGYGLAVSAHPLGGIRYGPDEGNY